MSSEDYLQMLLFDKGFGQSEENLEDDILLFEKYEMEVSLEIDNSITIYYRGEEILEVNDVDNETIAKIIEGICI